MLSIEEIATGGEFAITWLPERHMEFLRSSETQDLLKKWGIPLGAATHISWYRYEPAAHRSQYQELLTALFRSEALRATMRLADGRGSTTSFPSIAVDNVETKPLRCETTTMEMFERLNDDRVVNTHTGDACRMMDEYLPGGVTVADQLRGLFMLGESSEHYTKYSDDEKDEFLYHIMWRLLAGGAMNQWDEKFAVYRDATRAFYKDLVSVARNTVSGDLEVTSHVFQILSVGAVPLFPKDDQTGNHNYCYVVLNPVQRELCVWYHGFWSPF